MDKITIELTDEQRIALIDIVEFYQSEQSFSQDDLSHKTMVDDLWWVISQAA